VERRLQVEDGLAVLDGDDSSRRERATVADPVDLVEDRDRRVPGAQEVGVQRVDAARGIDRPGGGDERLAGDLAAEHALAVLVGLAPAEDVLLDLLEVEQVDELVERRSHAAAERSRQLLVDDRRSST
jgi:hypothetical protein